MPASPAPSSASSALTPLPSTPREDPPATPSASANTTGPRSRGYPEGMFSTPSRRMLPVVVIPTSEPRIDEVSGVSDGLSSLSSISRSGAASAIRSPGHFTTMQKRRRINSSVSPLSRMNKPPSYNDDEGDEESKGTDEDDDEEKDDEDGDVTIKDAATATSWPVRKRAREDDGIAVEPRRTQAKKKEDDFEPSEEEDDDDDDDELPDFFPTKRDPKSTRYQPKRAVTDKTKPKTGLRPETVVKPTAKHSTAPKRMAFKTSRGSDLSIAGLLRAKRQQANKGQDLDGMLEADALVRETEEREAEEAREKLKREAAERERKEVEAMQHELDQSFLSPHAKKPVDVIGFANAVSASNAKGGRKNSDTLLQTRHEFKPEGGCISDGLEDSSASSDSEDDSEGEVDHKSGHSGTDKKPSGLKMAERQAFFSGMSRTLKQAEVQGNEDLVDIIAADHGVTKKPKGKKAQDNLMGVDPPATSTIWGLGRVELPRVELPIDLEKQALGKIMANATRQGPWALIALLQQLGQCLPSAQPTSAELQYCLLLAVHGIDAASVSCMPGAASSSRVHIAPENNPAVHPWRTSRVERQAVATAACATLDAIARHFRTNSSRGHDMGLNADVDSLVSDWLVHAMTVLGAASAQLEQIRLLAPGTASTRSVPRRLRRKERTWLSKLASSGSKAQATTQSAPKGFSSDHPDVTIARQRGGWLTLDERIEAVGRICEVITVLCTHGHLSWPTRLKALIALSAFAASHIEDGLASAIGNAVVAILADSNSDLTEIVQQRQEEAANQVFQSFCEWRITAYARLLNGMPRGTTRSRAFARRTAWKALERQHASLRKTDVQTLNQATAEDAAVGFGISLPNLTVVQDLIVTSNDSSPFWISTAADDVRKAAAAQMESQGSSSLMTEEIRRVTDYADLAAWVDIINVALSDVAYQASSLKDIVMQQKNVPGDGSNAKPGPNPAEDVKASLILATRPLAQAAAASVAHEALRSNQVLPVPHPSGPRIRALRSISEGLRAACNKIIDHRGMDPDRSKAKDALQRAQIRLHYLVPFYFATGRIRDELRLPEIYGNPEPVDSDEAPVAA